MILFLKTAKKALQEYEKQGGNEKMKEVAIKDSKQAVKMFKEIVTYDIPQSFKKLIRSLDPRNYRK